MSKDPGGVADWHEKLTKDVDDVLARLLMGHSLGSNIGEGYLSRTMLRGPLREAQRRISGDIIKRLGLGVFDVR